MTSWDTQRAKILRVLVEANGCEVPLFKLSAIAAQYNARIFELRRMGYHIENRTETSDGTQHSWFRLLKEPDPPASKVESAPASQAGGRAQLEEPAGDKSQTSAAAAATSSHRSTVASLGTALFLNSM